MSRRRADGEVRGTRVRARTLARKQMLPIVEADRGDVSAEEVAAADAAFPRTRGECKDGPRPCPFVRCRWNLFLDVNPLTGSIKLNFPGREPWEMGESCALDVADRGGATLDDVGAAMNVVRERIRQEEARLLPKARAAGFDAEEWAALARETPRGRDGPESP